MSATGQAQRELGAERSSTAEAVAELGSYLWDDIGSKFTCIEADVIYEFLVAWGKGSDADVLMVAHAATDDCGDLHKIDETNSCGWTHNEPEDD